MPSSPTHTEVERRIRRLLAESGLAPPDHVAYEPRSVVFFWHGPRLAVFVDFDAEPPEELGAGLLAGIPSSGDWPSAA